MNLFTLLISALRTAEISLDIKTCGFRNKFSRSTGSAEIMSAEYTTVRNAELHHKFFF